MFSIWLAASSQAEDKSFVGCSRSHDFLSGAHLESTFRTARLGGGTDVCQLNKGDHRPEGKMQTKIFHCRRVSASEDVRL